MSLFNLEPYCLPSEGNPPEEDYIKVTQYSIYGDQNITGVCVPDMHPETGKLMLRVNGQIHMGSQRVTDYMNSLIHWVHLAHLKQGLVRFQVTSGIYIKVYLYIPLFIESMYLPTNIEFKETGLPPTMVVNARNTIVRDDYGSLFKHDLYDYQQNNVEWMIGTEELVSEGYNTICYPQLREMKLTRINHNNQSFFFNRNTKYLHAPHFEEQLRLNTHVVKGGIICDEVGLGKTCSILALIVNTLDRDLAFYTKKRARTEMVRELRELAPINREGSPMYTSNATIVFAPARLVTQWATEVDKFMIKNSDLRVYTINSIVQYRKLTVGIVCNADLIIVSYRFLNNTNYKKHSAEEGNFSLNSFYWKRIVLDEGHEILAPHSKTINYSARDILLNIRAKYYWICSGTPFAHNYESLDYYLHYLTDRKYEFDDYRYFNEENVNTFLRQCVRGNTYESIKTQIYIPPIEQTTVLLEQDPVERAMYVNATGDTTRMIQLCTNILVSDTDAGIIEGSTSLSIVRDRMHAHYVTEIEKCETEIEEYDRLREEAEDRHADAADLYEPNTEEYREYRSEQKTIARKWKAKIKDRKEHIKSCETRMKLFENVEERAGAEPCPICYDDMTDMVLTKCSHIFCEGCMRRVIRDRPTNVKCPMCRTELTRKEDIGYLSAQKVVTTDGVYHQHVQKWGTKMAWLVQYLHNLLAIDSDARIIVFSQWKRMLQLVGQVFVDQGINHVYLKGSAAQMGNSIRKFKTSKDMRVIMLSSETCSSGSNLTEASHILLLDTVNGSSSKAQAIEDQAIGRAARLGQDKNVQVVRMIMKNTVEHDFYTSNIEQADIREIEGGQNVVHLVPTQ